MAYANSYILSVTNNGVTVSDGRIIGSGLSRTLVICFLSRIQYSGVTSGSRKIPLESQLDGQMLPGASGDQFYYRGYALQYTTIGDDVDWLLGYGAYTGWKQCTQQYDFLGTGKEVELKIGDDPVLRGRIERSSGVYGGQGIDRIIYSEIGGVQLQLTGTELQN